MFHSTPHLRPSQHSTALDIPMLQLTLNDNIAKHRPRVEAPNSARPSFSTSSFVAHRPCVVRVSEMKETDKFDGMMSGSQILGKDDDGKLRDRVHGGWDVIASKGLIIKACRWYRRHQHHNLVCIHPPYSRSCRPSNTKDGVAGRVDSRYDRVTDLFLGLFAPSVFSGWRPPTYSTNGFCDEGLNGTTFRPKYSTGTTMETCESRFCGWVLGLTTSASSNVRCYPGPALSTPTKRFILQAPGYLPWLRYNYGEPRHSALADHPTPTATARGGCNL
ncbi:hypothetical protein B0H19DRAFT_1263330 [Mycena capillaripes]|nr:hypothetical protein B0H19DRAFT_1263330 [Mycena capillaripes]